MSLATPDRRAAKLVKQRPQSVRGATTVHDPTRSTTLLPLIRQPAAQRIPNAAGDSSDSDDGGYDTAPESPAPPSRSATPAPASIRSARPQALRSPGSASTRFKVTTPPNSAKLASPPPATPLPIPSVTSAQILDVLRVDASSPVPFPYTIQWPEIPPTPPETPDKRHLALPLRSETPPLQKKTAVEPPSAAAIKPIIIVPENRSRTNVINTPDQHVQKPANLNHVSNDSRTVKALKEDCIIDGRNDNLRVKGASGTNTNAGGTITRRGGAAGGLGTFMATLTPHPSLEPFAPPSSSSPTAAQVRRDAAKPTPTVTSKTKISHVKSASVPAYAPPVSSPGSTSASASAKPFAQPSARPSSADQAAAARNGPPAFGSLPKRPNADGAAAHRLAATHGPPPPAGKDAAEKLETKASAVAASPTAPATRPPTPMRLPPLSPWAPLVVSAKTSSAPPSPAIFPPEPAVGLAPPAPSLRRDAAPTPQPAAPPTAATSTSPAAASSPPAVAAAATPSRTLSRGSETQPTRKLHKAPPSHGKHSSAPPPATRARTPTSPVEMPHRRFSQLFPQKSEPERARLGSNSKLWPVARSVSLSRAASAGPNTSAIPRSVSTTSLVEPERAYHYTTRRMSTSTAAAMDKERDVDMLSLASAPGALALATEVDMVVAAGSATRRLRKATTRGPRRAASPGPSSGPAPHNRGGVLEDDVKEMVPRALFSIGGGRGGFAAHRRMGSVPPPVIIPPPSAMLPFPTLVTTGTATTVPPTTAAAEQVPRPESARSSACDSEAPRTPADIEVDVGGARAHTATASVKDEPEADFAGAQLLRSLGSLRRRVARVSGAALRGVGVGVGEPLTKRGGDVGADMMLVRARLRARAEDEESVVRSMVDSEC